VLLITRMRWLSAAERPTDQSGKRCTVARSPLSDQGLIVVEQGRINNHAVFIWSVADLPR
jgi:hypothetical protein